MDTSEPQQKTATAVPAWHGAFEAFKTAFEGLKRNQQPLLTILAIYAVAALVDAAMGKGTTTTLTDSAFHSESRSLVGFVVHLVFLAAIPCFALAVADGKTVSLGEIFKKSGPKYLTILGATILTALLYFLSVFTLGILLIWMVPWFSFTMYVILDKNLGAVDAIKHSKAMAKHHKGKVWGLIGAMIVYSLPILVVGIFGKLLGSFLATMILSFTGLLLAVSTAMLYRWLQKHDPVAVPAAETPAASS